MKKIIFLIAILITSIILFENKSNNAEIDKSMSEIEIISELSTHPDINKIITFNNYKIRSGRYEYLKMKHGFETCDELLLKELIKSDLLNDFALSENIIIEDEIINSTKIFFEKEFTNEYKHSFSITNGYKSFSNFINSEDLKSIIVNQHLETRYASFQMKKLKIKHTDISDREIFSIYKKEFNDAINVIYSKKTDK